MANAGVCGARREHALGSEVVRVRRVGGVRDAEDSVSAVLRCDVWATRATSRAVRDEDDVKGADEAGGGHWVTK